ncbi:NAD(P)H-dependent flavin oxidoreductase [Entomospira culicis]|uniref:Nitronate monooxygenase n=1 Tax=Entomospira culicis TaxID=2719989 RepID=A0A968GH27_9SPIO|nr:nitronate monooxygenase family protein [Entomospira culicis]NIZ18697.1 nitronate monooxygenase [Entomospira culicis]NIZ68912.1 nitronate monooxygenase [Entomospira culicis]WDI37505.1 nitronate monooxygenase family protein [Entomospira culicis]WDI39133.1 nitronate monooxygenase family protein [Entomospira culicis]
MFYKPLQIGDLHVPIPIIQGGMGVGVSLSGLASAVANAGGIGVISGAQIGFDQPDFAKNPLKVNLEALTRHIHIAKEKAKKGIIGVNLMVALHQYTEYVKTAVKSGADIIFSGAGLPMELPEFVKGSKTKIAPIVSSVRAAKLILNNWLRKFDYPADAVVVEGPMAGGHLGFAPTYFETKADFDLELVDIIAMVKEFGEKVGRKIPLIFGGGVFDQSDFKKYLTLGCDGIQMGTRFVATHECDAPMSFKHSYITAKESDITIIKSPVGMPGRAIVNPFMQKVLEDGRVPVKKCYKCLSKCNPRTIPYCITEALIHAAEGRMDEGLLFCGQNAHRIQKIVSVQELFDEMTQSA